jgi:pyruvate dehydrogenase E2 component (dihydrolipoamide acetyltransferase)
MPVEVILPRVDMDMSEAKISRWHVANGQAVVKGQTVFEIETDKAAMEIEAPASGTIDNISAEEGAIIAVGAPIAWIFAEGEPRTNPPTSVIPAWAGTHSSAGTNNAFVPSGPMGPGLSPSRSRSFASAEQGRRDDDVVRLPPATPAARRLARQHGIDLRRVSGSGPRGRIHGDDVVGSLRTAQASLHLLTRGEVSETPAVFIHGFGADLAIWKTTLLELDRTLSTVQLDLPAHGKSPLGGVRSFDDIVESVAASLDALKFKGCHLVGHSFGGMIALALAATKRLDVRSLMLISPAGLGPDIEREFLEGFTRATRVESLTPWLRLLFAKPSLVSGAFARAIMQSRDSEALRDQQRAIADTMFPDGTQANDLRTALDGLTMPCKIVWGRQDRIIPVTHTANLPGHVGLHLLADTGHVPHLEQPALLARLIAELIRAAR